MEISTSSEPSVHIVDDRSEDLQEMAAILVDSGFDVRTHAHGSSIIASVFKAKDPIVILADLHMPDINGWGVVETIASQGMWNGNVTFALVTGDVTYEATKKAFKYGIHDFIRKPIDPEELIGTVVRLTDAMGRQDSHRIKPSPSSTLNFVLSVFSVLDRQLHTEVGDADHFRLLARVCLECAHGKPISVSGLCYGSGVPFSTAHRRLKGLVRGGLIRMTDDARDRRRSLLEPTDRGAQIVAEVNEALMCEISESFEIERC